MDKAKRRVQLMNAARDVFVKKGYHSATVEDVVAHAKVARGTYYLYFEDKRAALEAILDRAFTRVGMAIVRVDTEDAARGMEAQARENLSRIVAVLLEDPASTRLLLSEGLAADAQVDHKLAAFYGELHSLVVETLREGQTLGAVRPGSPDVYAELVLGALKQVLRYACVSPNVARVPAALCDQVFSFFCVGCLSFGDAT